MLPTSSGIPQPGKAWSDAHRLQHSLISTCCTLQTWGETKSFPGGRKPCRISIFPSFGLSPFWLTLKDSGGDKPLSAGSPSHPLPQQDSPHKKLLGAGDPQEGEEDQEGLHGGWEQSTAPRTDRTPSVVRVPPGAPHQGRIRRPCGVGSDKQSRQEGLPRAQMFALFGKVNRRAAKLGRI